MHFLGGACILALLRYPLGARQAVGLSPGAACATRSQRDFTRILVSLFCHFPPFFPIFFLYRESVTRLSHPTDHPRNQRIWTLPSRGGSCVPALQRTFWGGVALVAFLHPPYLIEKWGLVMFFYCDERKQPCKNRNKLTKATSQNSEISRWCILVEVILKSSTENCSCRIELTV